MHTHAKLGEELPRTKPSFPGLTERFAVAVKRSAEKSDSVFRSVMFLGDERVLLVFLRSNGRKFVS